MGITEYIKTRLLNNRLEQYNTKRSYGDDDERPTLLADVTLTAKVYGINGKWTLDTTVDFEKIDGVWYFSKWDN